MRRHGAARRMASLQAGPKPERAPLVPGPIAAAKGHGGLVRGLDRLRALLSPAARLPELRHLPITLLEAIRFVRAHRQVARKVADGYFRDRLVLATYVEKSANTTICDGIARLQAKLGPDRPAPSSSYGVRQQPAWVSKLDAHDLRPELALYKPQGGVVNRMFAPTSQNLSVLRWLDVKYFIVLRHPADQVCALYTAVPEQMTEVWANNPIFAVPWRYYDGSLSRDEVIRLLITDGYLFSMLKFVTDWLRNRDPAKSMVLRYEDFTQDKRAFFSEIARFLYGAELDDALAQELQAIAEDYRSRHESRGAARRYTSGYSGAVGIHDQYLSDENRKAYLSTVEDFLRVYPGADLLRQVYPDLLDLETPR